MVSVFRDWASPTFILRDDPKGKSATSPSTVGSGPKHTHCWLPGQITEKSSAFAEARAVIGRLAGHAHHCGHASLDVKMSIDRECANGPGQSGRK
jgi:hypothetical protein